MRLSIDSGNVVCSLDNKNSEFLSACSGWGLWDGYFHGQLKMQWDKLEESHDPDYALEKNAQRLKKILSNARNYGIEIDVAVHAFNDELQSAWEGIKAKREALMLEEQLREDWARLCRNGCGKCKNLTYDIDLPICKKTGEILEEKNVQKYMGGVLHLFNLEPFPSDTCPFNVNVKKGATNERLSETCVSKTKT